MLTIRRLAFLLIELNKYERCMKLKWQQQQNICIYKEPIHVDSSPLEFRYKLNDTSILIQCRALLLSKLYSSEYYYFQIDYKYVQYK